MNAVHAYDAPKVRQLFEQGQPFALGQPLLPLLLMTEVGQPWCERGLTVFLRRVLRERALSPLYGSFTLRQWQGPVSHWACSLVPPVTDRMMRVHLALSEVRRGRDAWDTFQAATTAAGVSPWPAGLQLARRLEADWPKHRQRLPTTELAALERLLGVEVRDAV